MSLEIHIDAWLTTFFLFKNVMYSLCDNYIIVEFLLFLLQAVKWSTQYSKFENLSRVSYFVK